MPLSDYSLATLHQFVGRELGVSEWVVIDQARIDAFAECTGDHQWIHTDVERASRESRFGGTIAHGLLTLSLLPAFRQQIGIFPDGLQQVVNYGYDRIRFLTPVKAGERIRARVSLWDVETRDDGTILLKTQNVIELDGGDTPALVAIALTLLIPDSSH